MGLFGKISQAFGGVDQELLSTGILGRGIIAAAVPSGGTVQVAGGLVERICQIQVQVLLNGGTPYMAQVQQRLPEVYLSQLSSGMAAVAVRVDPANAQHIAIDLQSPAPSVRLGRNTGPGSASYILEYGSDAQVVLVQSSPLGFQNYLGYEMYALVLTVAEGAPQPYQLAVSGAVPPESLPLLYPGSRLPAKIGSQQNEVVVDFSRAGGTPPAT
jgi:hypothetical protein